MPRTYRLQNGDSKNNKIYSHMCSSSKEVYNSYLFCAKFFNLYKIDTYEQIYKHMYNENINSFEEANKYFLEIFQNKLTSYSENFKNVKTNNDVAYSFINEFLKDKVIDNHSYHKIYNSVIESPELKQKMIWNNENKKYMYTDIISNILEKRYSRKFFNVSYKIKNNIPIEEENVSIIPYVKNDEYLFKNKYDNIFNLKKWTSDLIFFKTMNIQTCNKIGMDFIVFNDIYKNIKNKYLDFIKIYKTPNVNNKCIELTFISLHQSINKLKTIDKIYSFNSKNVDVLLQSINDLQKKINSQTSDYCCKMVIQILKLLEKESRFYNDKIKGCNLNYVLNAYKIFEIVNDIRYSCVYDTKKVTKNLNKLKPYINVDTYCQLFELCKNSNTNNKNILEIDNITQNILSQTMPQLENKNLTSDQTLLETLTRSILKKSDNNTKLPSDVINNIFHKAQESINSYYQLKNNGRKFARFPNFIKKGSQFGIKYLCGKSMYISDNKIKLFVGKYINQNRNIFSKLECVQLQTNLNHSPYAYLSDMKNEKKKGENAFMYSKNGKNYFINKKSNLIFDGGYISFDIPKNLFCENADKKLEPIFSKIIQLEIVPAYKKEYNIHITYEPKNKFPIIEKNKFVDSITDAISVDLGMINLMSVYDPNGEQFIIKGNKIISMNEYFNKQIAIVQSEIKIKNNLHTSKKMQNLLKKRENSINDYFNKLVNKFFDMCKNKKLIIIGYNIGWKNSPKLGRQTKRKFIKIPFRKLINKMYYRAEKMGIRIIEINESHTSKCDALSFEKVKKHNNYKGKRVKRGLFKSKKGRLLNADINASINIMRKYCAIDGMKFDTITGKNIYNPKIVKQL